MSFTPLAFSELFEHNTAVQKEAYLFSGYVRCVLILVLALSMCTVGHSQTVKIGSQVWSTRNLDVSTFRNGDPIPEAKTEQEWKDANNNQQPAWRYYNNEPANGKKYGKLYNWFAVVDPRGLAPVGWHIPFSQEWETLHSFLLGIDPANYKEWYEKNFRMDNNVIGVKLKSKAGWKVYSEGGSKDCPDCVSWSTEYRKKVPCHTCKDFRKVPVHPVVLHVGNNSTGFSAQPGGLCTEDGVFVGITEKGAWWRLRVYHKWNDCIDKGCVAIPTHLDKSRHGVCGIYPDSECLSYNDSGFDRFLGLGFGFGMSVRCIKD